MFGPPPHAGGWVLNLYPARDYFGREGVAQGAIAALFVFQSLGVTLALGHAGLRALLLVPLAVGAWLTGHLLLSRLQVRRWWREAGDGPSWDGGADLHLGVADHLVLVAILEILFLSIAVYAVSFVWSFVMGIVVAASMPVGYSVAIAREERRRNEVLLVRLRRRARFLPPAPELW
ncbi:MAG: hypothetical protein ACP5PW_06005, partial [Candidatus Dormibacteria bacterium]